MVDGEGVGLEADAHQNKEIRLMVGLSSAGEALVLTPLTTTAYVSLHTADPSDAGASEVSGGGYARPSSAVTFTSTGANPTVSANNAIVTFPVATGAWGTVTHFGIWSAVSGGTFRGSGALTTSKAVGNGDTARFAVGALTITAN
jgi:hypothetical protein